MTTENERLDHADEIYLTENEFEHWFRPGNSRPELLLVASTPLLLHDHCDSAPWNPSQFGDLSSMVRLAFGEPEPVPVPETEVRKLTRGADTVWTLFRYDNRVIAANDDGSLVTKLIPESFVNGCKDLPVFDRNRFGPEFPPISFDDWNMRIDRAGNLIIGGVEQTPEQLAMSHVKGSFKLLQSEVKVWVKREHGRRAPLGISRLLKRIDAAIKIYPPLPLMSVAEICSKLAFPPAVNSTKRKF